MVVTHEHSPVVAGADFYPFGLPMDGREIKDEFYRYGYQGQYSEKDTITGWNRFELRMYDARFGRWLSVDPYGQYASPYLAMGNNPHMGADPDGGFCCFPSGALVVTEAAVSSATAASSLAGMATMAENASMVASASSGDGFVSTLKTINGGTLQEFVASASRLTSTRVLPALTAFGTKAASLGGYAANRLGRGFVQRKEDVMAGVEMGMDRVVGLLRGFSGGLINFSYNSGQSGWEARQGAAEVVGMLLNLPNRAVGRSPRVEYVTTNGNAPATRPVGVRSVNLERVHNLNAKGERGQTGKASGTDNPFKKLKPDPNKPGNVLEKNSHTGKTVSKPAPEGFMEWWNSKRN